MTLVEILKHLDALHGSGRLETPERFQALKEAMDMLRASKNLYLTAYNLAYEADPEEKTRFWKDIDHFSDLMHGNARGQTDD